MALSCEAGRAQSSDLAWGWGVGPGSGRRFQGLESTCASSPAPWSWWQRGGALESRSSGPGPGAEEVEGLAQGPAAWQRWGNAQSLSPFGALAAQLWASLCCHLLLVLLSGVPRDAISPPPSSGSSGHASQGPGLSGLRQPLCQVVGTQDWPGVLNPVRNQESDLHLSSGESLGAGIFPGAPAHGCGGEAAWGAGVICERNLVLRYFPVSVLWGWQPGARRGSCVWSPQEGAPGTPWGSRS